MVLHPHKKSFAIGNSEVKCENVVIVRDVSAFALSATTEKESASWWSSTPDDDFDFDFDFDVVSERRATTPKMATRVVDDDGGGEAFCTDLEASSTLSQPLPRARMLEEGEPPKQHHQLGGAGKNDDDVGDTRHAEETGGGAFGLIAGELEIKAKRELKERRFGYGGSSC